MNADRDSPLIIEFSQGAGVRQVATTGPEALQRSAQAVNDAMGIIRQMAGRVRRTVQSVPGRPSEIEVAFGIKFDAQAGAMIAKAGVEASINVLFRWDINDRADEIPGDAETARNLPRPTEPRMESGAIRTPP